MRQHGHATATKSSVPWADWPGRAGARPVELGYVSKISRSRTCVSMRPGLDLRLGGHRICRCEPALRRRLLPIQPVRRQPGVRQPCLVIGLLVVLVVSQMSTERAAFSDTLVNADFHSAPPIRSVFGACQGAARGDPRLVAVGKTNVLNCPSTDPPQPELQHVQRVRSPRSTSSRRYSPPLLIRPSAFGL